MGMPTKGERKGQPDRCRQRRPQLSPGVFYPDLSFNDATFGILVARKCGGESCGDLLFWNSPGLQGDPGL